jgi:hypothetical protein
MSHFTGVYVVDGWRRRVRKKGAKRVWMEGRRGFVKIVVGRDNIVTELFSYQMLSKEEKRERGEVR